MPTMRQYVAEMLRRVPGEALGREEAIASLTTTTVVVTAMATGTVSSQKYVNKWLWRPDTATAADRIRVCSAFTSSSGTFTHAGTNYGDTTATGEYVFILEYEPRSYMDAIQTTLARLQRLDRETMPSVAGVDRYWLPSAWTWIRDPADVEAISWSQSPVLSRNRHMEKWNAYQSSGGTLACDDWTLAGSGAVLTRSATVRRGRYSASLERVGNDVTFSQAVPALYNGVDNDSLEGKTVMVVGVGYATAASRLRFTISAGGSSSSTSYHTGGSDWEELTATLSIPTAATGLTIQAEVNTGNTTALVDELYAVEVSTLTDGIRRGTYEESFLRKDEYQWDQGAGQLGIKLPVMSRGGTWSFYAGRPYPQFDNTRVISGSADSDSSDAPLDVVAIGAIARMYEGLAQEPGRDGAKYAGLAKEFGQRFERMAAAHRGVVRKSEGANIPHARLYAHPAARW